MPPIKYNKKEIIWNEDIENLLKDAQRECVKYAILHNIDREKYYNYHNYLFIVNACLTSLSGSSVIIKNAFFNDIEQETSSLINISFGVILIFATILSSFQHTTNYAEQSRNHKDAYTKFTSLGNNMLKLLALDKATKETSIEFYEWSETEFTNLQMQSPNPSNYAYRIYKKDNPPGLLHVNVIKDNKIGVNRVNDNKIGVKDNKIGVNRVKKNIQETSHSSQESSISETSETLENKLKSKETILDFNKKRFANNMYI